MRADMYRSKQLGAITLLGVALLAPGCAKGKNQTQPQSPTAKPEASQSANQTVFGQAAPPMATPPVLAGTPDIAALVEKVQPVVVNITTSSSVPTPKMVDPFEFFFGPNGQHPMLPGMRQPGPRSPGSEGPSMQQRRALGTGFVIDSAGYVVTNNHVIDGADEVSVRLADDHSYAATVVGRDERLDVALLHFDGASGLPAAVLGDSDALRVGEYVVAMGNPFGLGHTVTMGIVSAKDRTIGAGPYDDFIQTDASINPGNSGGPLFNLRGEIVGINTAIHAQGQGIGFAIPINMVRDAVLQLKQTGHVSRGKLGIVFQPVNDDIAKAMGLDRPRGALVTEVEPGGPAARAGLKTGDLIVDVDGDEVAPSSELPRLIASNAPGTSVRLKYLRDGHERTATVTLDALESDDKGIGRAPKGGAAPSSKFGLSMTPNPGGGVQVTDVTGAVAGKLTRGDVIEQVNGVQVSTPAQVVSGISNAKKSGRPALVKVRRGDHILFVAIDPTE